MAMAKLFNRTGQAKGTVDLPGDLFGQPVHRQALYEAVKCYLANQRAGTHNTLNRDEVQATSAKMFKQKGTGRARMGSIVSASRVGGGIAHGPHPRDYGYKLPRKIKRLALKSALSDRAASERVAVVEDFALEAPKTSLMAKMLGTMQLEGRHTLVVLTGDGNSAMYKSLRNIKGVRVLRSDELNAYTILWADNLVFTEASLAATAEVFA